MKNILIKLMLGITLMTYSLSAVDITTWKTTYPTRGDVWIQLHDKPNNNKDWIGIYPAKSNNSWSNVVQWEWARNTSPTQVDLGDWYKFKKLKDGDYEARFFLNNTFVTKDKISFSIGKKIKSIRTLKKEYKANEKVSVKVTKDHLGEKDWVGIYPKNSNNSWVNVIAWNWISKNDKVSLTKIEKEMPIGEYEVRLFFNNTYKDEAKYTFSVKGNTNNYMYGSEGIYLNKVKINNDSDEYVVYYPEGHIQNAPVILFFGMSYAMGNYANNNKTSLRHEGIMKYLASLGCYVIGNKKTTGGWTDATQWPNYTQALVNATNKGADTSKLGIVGHSAGGMASYWWMKKYKEEGYGNTKTFIIDLHGYFAANMTENDLSQLADVDSLIIAYGGLNGNANQSIHTNNPNFSQNPRVLLTLSHLLPNSVKKGFVVLNTRNHMYSYGEWEETIINGDNYSAIKNKKDLLEPIDAMVKYEWFNNNGQYNNAQDILFNNYTQTIKNVDDATENFLLNDGNYRFDCNTKEGINYCEDYK